MLNIIFAKEEWFLVHIEIQGYDDKSKVSKKGIETGLKKGRLKGREEGFEEGILKGKAEVVSNFLLKMNLTDAQAADIAGVSVDFVKKVRRKLKK